MKPIHIGCITMKRVATTILSIIAVVGISAWAAAAEPSSQTKPAPTTKPNEVQEDPSLPNVLIIGDSISLGYTGRVKELLKGKANVIHSSGNSESSGTAVGYATWAAHTEKKWAIIHFNYGLWDVSHDHYGKQTAEPGTTPAQYEKNLRAAVKILKTTGAKIIFGTTTPLPEDLQAKWNSVPERNEIAKKIMQENDGAIDDLYSAILPKQKEFQPKNLGVHFNAQGSDILAKSVAASIEAQLPTNTPKADGGAKSESSSAPGAAPSTQGAASPPPNPTSGPITRGQRVFSTGHSFHAGFASILDEISKSAGFTDSRIVGISGIGGSKVIQHWGGKEVQAALTTETVDVLMTTSIYLPDPGLISGGNRP